MKDKFGRTLDIFPSSSFYTFCLFIFAFIYFLSFFPSLPFFVTFLNMSASPLPVHAWLVSSYQYIASSLLQTFIYLAFPSLTFLFCVSYSNRYKFHVLSCTHFLRYFFSLPFYIHLFLFHFPLFTFVFPRQCIQLVGFKMDTVCFFSFHLQSTPIFPSSPS